MSRFAFAYALGVFAFAACSSGSSSTGTTGGPSGPTITIKNYTFSPDPLMVAAGATVTVVNGDGATIVHTATSDVDAGSFVKGQVPNGFTFDTGNIQPGTSATFTIPAGLSDGTTQPYFCEQHMGMMDNPHPSIVIKN